jgi:hypothetical protein
MAYVIDAEQQQTYEIPKKRRLNFRTSRDVIDPGIVENVNNKVKSLRDSAVK